MQVFYSVGVLGKNADREYKASNMRQIRLKQARESRGLMQTELAEITGFSQPEISRWEKGVRSPTTEQIYVIAAALGCDPGELVGAESGDCHKIPVIGEVPGGELQEALEQHAEDFIYFETQKRNVFALRVRGTSVNRMIPDGGFAVVDPGDNDPARLVNQLVVVVFDRGGMYESTCKIYRQNPTRFEPFSTERHDTIFPGNDPWRILGRVFGSVSFLGGDLKLIAPPR